MVYLLAILAAVVTPYEVTVETFDGEPVRGAIVNWGEAELELSSADGSSHRVTHDTIAKIIFPKMDFAQASSPKLRAILVDGSILPADGIQILGTESQLVGLSGGKESALIWKVPTEVIRAVRFNLSDLGQDLAWRELVDRDRTRDWLVVHKKKSNTLDFIEGIIEEVSQDNVTILLEDEPVAIPMEKVFGLIFYRRVVDSASQGTLTVRGLNGLTLTGRDVRCDPNQVEIDLSIGDTVSFSPDAIHDIVFSTDTVLYLTELDSNISAEDWEPFFEIPADSSLLKEWGLPRRGNSFSGEPLNLLARDRLGRIKLLNFEHGLALRSRSQLAYTLPSGYKTFSFLVGMDPETHADSDAILIVELDGRSAGEWRVVSGEPAQTIDVVVTGKRRLRLLIDYGSGTDAGDVVHLCEPRLLK